MSKVKFAGWLCQQTILIQNPLITSALQQYFGQYKQYWIAVAALHLGNTTCKLTY